MGERFPTSRRVFLAATGAGGLSAAIPGAFAVAAPASASGWLDGICDMVIPPTQTAGAGRTGVANFVVMALDHGLEGSRSPAVDPALPRREDGSVDHLRWLAGELDRRAGSSFSALPPGRRASILADVDAEAFPAGPPPAHPSPWVTIKTLILTGYYTSETGGSKELRYEPVPGQWNPDLPQTPNTRALSNDWTAVDFG